MMPPTEENRLTRLEEQSYFQEQALAELSQAMTRQQFQLDAMEKRLTLAEKRIAALLPLLEEDEGNGLPPHYATLL